MAAQRALLAALLLTSVASGAQQERSSGLSSAGARQRSLEEAWSRDLAAPANPETKVVEYKTPQKRVTNLLGKMKAELTAEQGKEAEMYDKMVCWCDTSEKEKTKAVADADAKDLELTSEVESRSAALGRLEAEIANMKGQIADDTQALKQATAIREKGAGEFKGEELDLVQAIDNLRNAIAVLSKHHGGSLLQLDGTVQSGMRVLLRNVALQYELLRASRGPARRGTAFVALASGQGRGSTEDAGRALLGELESAGSAGDALPLKFAERVVTQAATAARGTAFLQVEQPTYADYKSYSSRSTKIYGLLTQMLEEFEAELKRSQGSEATSEGDYKALAEAKSEQIAVGKKKLDELEAERADNQQALSNAKEDLELTRAQRSADVKFLQNLKLTCNDLDAEWERRSATRSEELKAVTEAIAILTEDDNREHLAKTVTFLQVASRTSAAARRVQAAKALRRAAAAPGLDTDDLLAAWQNRKGAAAPGLSDSARGAAGARGQLSALALTVQLDSFTKVKEMMDKMVAQLKEEQEEEVKFKAYCVKELDDNEKAVYGKTEEKKDLQAKIAQLAAMIDKLQKEVAEAKSQIADTQVGVKKAGENREKENAEFQTTVADQRATQAILKKALLRLGDFYTKGIGRTALLLQRQQQKAAQTPPVQFNKYKANSGSSPVMGLIEQIIEDSKQLETEATQGEYKAQADYEAFVKDSNGLISDLSASVSSKEEAIAGASVESETAKGDLTSTEGELESLGEYEANLHSECDFRMKNFEIRQKARLQEIEAIQAAKGILAGSA